MWPAEQPHLLCEFQKVRLGSEEEEGGRVFQWKALIRRLFTTRNLISIAPVNVGDGAI